MSKLKNIVIYLVVLIFVITPISPVFADDVQNNQNQEEGQQDISNEGSQSDPNTESAEENEPSQESEQVDDGSVDDPVAEPIEEIVDPQPTGTDLSFKLPTGATKTKVDEKTGALIYQYPIDLPEGRAGMTPELSLSYNSRSLDRMDSIAGLGWELSIPYIKREPTNGTNNLYTSAYFSSSESGNLVATSSTQFSQHIVYRPETDEGSYLKYSFNNDNSWTVVDKNGRTYVYGQTAESRQDDPSGMGDIYKWMITKIIDTHGNEIRYTYVKDEGQIYPNQIIYTYHQSAPAVNTVSFTYSSPANYGSTVYNSAYPVTTSKLLSSITVSTTIDSATSSSAYQLNFIDAQFLKQKLISSIERTNSFPGAEYNQNFDDTTSFTYSIKTPGWENGSFTVQNYLIDYDNTNSVLADTYTADFDRNGFEDVLISAHDALGNLHNSLLMNDGSNFVESKSSWNLPEVDISADYAIADLNGDDLPDLQPRNITNPIPPVYLNAGTSFVPDNSGTWLMKNYIPEVSNCGPNVGDRSSYSTNTFLVDINGDSKNDIVYFGGPTNFKVYLNNGSGWSAASGYTFTTQSGTNFDFSRDCNFISQGDNMQSLIDVNGDGLKDYYHIGYGTYLNTGSGFAYSPAYTIVSNDSGRSGYADINGDGLVDFIASRNYSGSYCPTVLINTGSGFRMVNPTAFPPCTNSEVWSPTDLRYTQNPNQFGTLIDVTSDGLPDILGSLTGGYTGKVRSINDAKDTWVSNPNANNQWQKPIDPGHGKYFDLNSDGITDFITPYTTWDSSHQSPKKVYTGKQSIPNRLTQITTPLGATTTVTYGTVTTNYSDTDISPMPVVQKVAITNIGQSQPDMVTQYDYSGGAYILDPATGNKRFAGFQKVTSKESGTDLVPQRITETYFHQNNGSDSSSSEPSDDNIALIGKPYYSVVKNSTQTTTQESWTSYGKKKLVVDPQNEAMVSTFVYPTDYVVKTTDSSGSSATAEKYEYNLDLGERVTVTNLGFVDAASNGSYADIAGDTRYQVIRYAVGVGNNIVKPSHKDIRTMPQDAYIVTSTDYYYDQQNLNSIGGYGDLTKEVGAINSTNNTFGNTVYTYDQYGNKLSETNPRNFTTTYSYDNTNSRLAAETNSMNQTTTYEYVVGKPKKVTDPNGRVTTFGYSSEGWLYRTTVANTSGNQITLNFLEQHSGNWAVATKQQIVNANYDRSWQYYDNLGRPTRNVRELRNYTTGANGSYYLKKSIEYDSLGRAIKESAPYGISSGDPVDQLLAVIPSALTTTTVYDILDRPLSVANAIGTTNYSYSGNESTITDPRGNPKDMKMDAYGNLIEVTEHNGSQEYVTNYGYDTRNLLINITDAEGNVRNFNYNTAGWLTSSEDLHDPSDVTYGINAWDYDLNGNQTVQTKPDGTVITTTHDQLDRPTIIDSSSTPETDYLFSYDSCTNGLGRLCNVNGNLQNGVSVSKTFVYGISGLPTAASVTALNNTYTTQYQYNLGDTTSSITYPNDTIVRYGFGDWGLPATVYLTLPNGTESNYATVTYHHTGKPLTITTANGLVETHNYDNGKLYRETSMTATANGTPVQSYEYKYDSNNNITRITESDVTKNYSYDDLNRLVEATYSPFMLPEINYNYEYDAIGNITSMNGNEYVYNNEDYNNPHAATQAGNDKMEYDHNGNMVVAPGKKELTYNWQNQPTHISSGSNGSEVNAYYDESGGRIIYQTANSTEVQVGSDYLVRGSDPEISLSVGGVPLGVVSGGVAYSSVADHLGSNVRQVGSGGSVAEAVSYDPFGAITHQGGTLNTKKGYTGHEEDAETGLVYAKARYYNPAIGRFASEDPLFITAGFDLSDPQSMNSYTYVANNPIRLIDPNGESPWDIVTTAAHMAWGGVKEAANQAVGLAVLAYNLNKDPVGTSYTVAKSLYNTGKQSYVSAKVLITSHQARQEAIQGTKIAGNDFLNQSLAAQADQAGHFLAAGTLFFVGGPEGRVGSEAANGLRIGEEVGSLGRVVENSPGKITGFNHNGTFHGIDQIISRGVSPQALLDTVSNPLATFEGRFGRTGYLSRDAFVSLDRTGQVVTSWTSKQFKSTIKNVLNRIK